MTARLSFPRILLALNIGSCIAQSCMRISTSSNDVLTPLAMGAPSTISNTAIASVSDTRTATTSTSNGTVTIMNPVMVTMTMMLPACSPPTTIYSTIPDSSSEYTSTVGTEQETVYIGVHSSSQTSGTSTVSVFGGDATVFNPALSSTSTTSSSIATSVESSTQTTTSTSERFTTTITTYTTTGYLSFTSTLATTASASTETVEIIVPMSCPKGGIEYAVVQNPYALQNRSDLVNSANYTGFDPSYFWTVPPNATNITQYLGYANPGRSGPYYAAPYTSHTNLVAQKFAINHRAYLHTILQGTYTFTFNLTDDYAGLWIGDTAIRGWTRDNAKLQHFYYNWTRATPLVTEVSYSQTFDAGLYVPFRILWANAEGPGTFNATITAPGGLVIVNNVTTFAGPWVTTGSCDGSYVVPFEPFGKET